MPSSKAHYCRAHFTFEFLNYFYKDYCTVIKKIKIFNFYIYLPYLFCIITVNSLINFLKTKIFPINIYY